MIILLNTFLKMTGYQLEIKYMDCKDSKDSFSEWYESTIKYFKEKNNLFIPGIEKKSHFIAFIQNFLWNFCLKETNFFFD